MYDYTLAAIEVAKLMQAELGTQEYDSHVWCWADHWSGISEDLDRMAEYEVLADSMIDDWGNYKWSRG